VLRGMCASELSRAGWVKIRLWYIVSPPLCMSRWGVLWASLNVSSLFDVDLDVLVVVCGGCSVQYSCRRRCRQGRVCGFRV
jgi:hypothetical protein